MEKTTNEEFIKDSNDFINDTMKNVESLVNMMQDTLLENATNEEQRNIALSLVPQSWGYLELKARYKKIKSTWGWVEPVSSYKKTK